jgi:hypothetical protein
MTIIGHEAERAKGMALNTAAQRRIVCFRWACIWGISYVSSGAIACAQPPSLEALSVRYREMRPSRLAALMGRDPTPRPWVESDTEWSIVHPQFPASRPHSCYTNQDAAATPLLDFPP